MGAKRSQVWKECAILAPEVNSEPSVLSAPSPLPMAWVRSASCCCCFCCSTYTLYCNHLCIKL